VAFSGLSSAGLYQLNFTVPAGLGTGDAVINVGVGSVFAPVGSGPFISLQ
jgi:uncharacterized protein (TIGR03437 family)